MRMTFQYRLLPSKSQRTNLAQTLELCRWVYNETLATRKNAWEQEQKIISHYDTIKMLPGWKQSKPELKQAHSQVLQEVCTRVDMAFQIVQARWPKHLPTVLSKTEVERVLRQMSGETLFMAQLLYGCDLRLTECLRLRVKDVDFEQHQIMVRDPKGMHDRTTMLPNKTFLMKYYFVQLLAALPRPPRADQLQSLKLISGRNALQRKVFRSSPWDHLQWWLHALAV
jgi:site-specific recombinase XerD